MFCTDFTTDIIIKCDIAPELKPVLTDHAPIAIILDISKIPALETEFKNFRMTNWDKFKNSLERRLRGQDPDKPIPNKEMFTHQIKNLVKAIQDVIGTDVPTSSPTQYTRRW